MLTQPLTALLGRAPAGASGARARPAPRRGRSAPLRALASILAAAAGLLARRRARVACLALSAAALVLGGGWMLLRGSSLSAVRHVEVQGATGPQAAAIATDLSEAARRMSTLSVSRGRLRAAVEQFPIVKDVRAYPSFPHGLRIVVVEQPPVAVLSSGGERTAVAADGIVLGPALLSQSLPTLNAGAGAFTARRVTSRQLLAALALLGAAPAVLRAQVAGVSEGSKGLTVTMRNGLLVYFGDGGLPHAKWLSLARVLVDPGSRGASYIDVRLPSRPAAGGFASGSGPATVAAGGEGQPAAAASSGEPSVEALAAALAGTSGAGTGPATTTSAEPSEAAGGEGGEHGSGGSSEAGAAGASAEASG